MSFSFALLGIGAIVYLQNDTRRKYISYVIFFYVLMELLQTVQYSLLNDCENTLNQMLTEVAFLLIIVQPLLWNFYFYSNSPASEGGIFKVGMALAAAWIAFVLLGRVLYSVPGTNPKKNSWLYGDKVCTYKGTSHLYWQWTTADLGELNATFLMYLLVWFVPGLISVTHFTSSLFLMAGAALGTGLTLLWGDMREFPSIWCYISVPLIGLIIGKDILHYTRGTGKA